MDLDAVRTFVAVVEAGQFHAAAATLAVTQQAVSKRIATLETTLGVRLFARTPRGTQLTREGHVFLPHARELLAAEARALNSVRLDRRPLRVDVLSSRIGPAHVMREFHGAHPEIGISVVTHLFDVESALAALRSGAIDATFRAVTRPEEQLGGDIAAIRVLDDPVELLTGHAHELAGAASVTPAALAAHEVWMPSNVPGAEWSSYYEALSARFGLTIDTVGPNFGIEALLEAIAGSSTLATFVGEHIRLVWPSEYDLRRIPVRDPMLVYPHSMLFRIDDPHPGLAMLRRYLRSRKEHYRRPRAWTPSWAVH
ncbi:LysR family transcriptional regulator [Chondromyces crocatus]|uniref:LysR family transcriptional regulator n=1 Tax=Chondromyces crocatus TaxID=52 RepID=A0A0K1ECC8_CHOCO|nr:LysR family transcriptional regulator [Chondromyces crocatus]AKT38525.1 LysR family transcriptional regulator [Chondromyces crocatus]